jgi:diacylglycerol kinase family enzyme
MESIDISTSHDFENNSAEIVLVNPKAGSGAASRSISAWKSLLPSDYKLVTGSCPADTERLAAQAAFAQVPRLIIVGGDGTLHHALNGYLSVPNTRTRLAVLPSGTANDFAASLYPHAKKKQNQNLTVDVGRIRHETFQRYFLNVAGIGLTAHAAISSLPSPWFPARLRYTLGLMRTLMYGWRHTETSIQLPNQILPSIQLLTLSVAIGTREGSFSLAPTAQLDDGQFNILIATNLRRRDVLRYLPGLMLGKLPHRDSRIQYLVAPYIQFRSAKPLHLHLDGEIYADGLLPAHSEITLEQAGKISIELLKTR